MEPPGGDRRSTTPSCSTKPWGPGALAAQRRLSGLQSGGPTAPPPTSASLYVADRAVAAAHSARSTQKAELLQYLAGHQGTVGRMLQSTDDAASSELAAATGTGGSRGSTAQSLRAPGSFIQATGSYYDSPAMAIPVAAAPAAQAASQQAAAARRASLSAYLQGRADLATTITQGLPYYHSAGTGDCSAAPTEPLYCSNSSSSLGQSWSGPAMHGGSDSSSNAAGTSPDGRHGAVKAALGARISTAAAAKVSPRFHDEAADLRQSILVEGRARRVTAASVRSPSPTAPAGSGRSSSSQFYPTGPDTAPASWESQQGAVLEQQQAGFTFSAVTAAGPAGCHTHQPHGGSNTTAGSSEGSGSDSGDADESPDSEDGQLFHNGRVRGWRQRGSMVRGGRQLSLSPAASGLAPAPRASLARRPTAAVSTAAARRLSAVKSTSPGGWPSGARGSSFKRSLSSRSSGGLRLSMQPARSGRCSTGQALLNSRSTTTTGSSGNSSSTGSGSSTRRSSSDGGPARFANRGPSLRLAAVRRPSGALAAAAAPVRRFSRSTSSVVRRPSVRASVHARSMAAARRRSGSLTAASADAPSGSGAAASIKGLLQQRAARQRRSVAVSRLLSLGQRGQAGSSGSRSSLEGSRRSSDSATNSGSSSSDAQQRVGARAAAVSRHFSQTAAQPRKSVAAAAAARRAAAAVTPVRPSHASGRYSAGSGFRRSAASEDAWSTHSTTGSSLTSSGGGGHSNAGSSTSAASEARRSLTGALETMLNPPRGKAGTGGRLSLSEHDAAAVVLGRRSSSGNGGDGQARRALSSKSGASGAGFTIPPPRHSRTLKRCGSKGSGRRGNGRSSIGPIVTVAARASAVRPGRKTWVQVYDEAVAASAAV